MSTRVRFNGDQGGLNTEVTVCQQDERRNKEVAGNTATNKLCTAATRQIVH
jgi:hypothetical protein